MKSQARLRLRRPTKKWAYLHREGCWSVRGSYDEADNVQYLHMDRVVHTISVPGYRIWNYAAHLHDVIPQLEELLTGASA